MTTPPELQITGNTPPECEALLTPACIAFALRLAQAFGGEARALLAAREEAAARRDAGELPAFAPETEEIRKSEWQVAPPPPFLQDRRVEITAPAERKKTILALNSDAKVFMADFEDSLTPTWANLMRGQLALFDAARGECTMRDETRNKNYALNPEHKCALIVRPRGWHLQERHVLLNGVPIPGALWDFAVFFHHNAKILLERGRAPCFYLPKTEHWREAELWEKAMSFAEKEHSLPQNCAKATLLIETLPAVFQMHEILHAMRGRLTGLNCGRWDYIFSYIKTLRAFPERVLPGRETVTMAQPFLAAYSRELVETCHKRGAHAMGGMSAFIPIRGDEKANAKALEQVRADKRRELANGHDGTWVAHPDLIAVAREVFDEAMPGENQKTFLAGKTHSAEQLLQTPEGEITADGFDNNIHVALHYIAAWLGGAGAVPIFNLMEDAATAEIARTQLWQWQKYGAKLQGGETVTAALFEERLKAVLPKVKTAASKFAEAGGGATSESANAAAALHTYAAAELLRDLVRSDLPPNFLTTPASEMID